MVIFGDLSECQIYICVLFFVGIVSDLTNIHDPLFVCERSALDQLVTGLMKPCQCGQLSWITSSHKQVQKCYPSLA